MQNWPRGGTADPLGLGPSSERSAGSNPVEATMKAYPKKARPLDLVAPGTQCFCEYCGDESPEDGLCYFCYRVGTTERKYDYRTGKLLNGQVGEWQTRKV